MTNKQLLNLKGAQCACKLTDVNFSSGLKSLDLKGSVKFLYDLLSTNSQNHYFSQNFKSR